jgi:2-polyprenyl-6-methoxyphenol hydroxylase-like FAD-dependent oxidoreductase
MRRIGEHGLVLGASIAGLMAARVLADAYQHVTVVERDPLPSVSEARKGVPQGRHAHALLAGGAQRLENLFPGLLDELVASGAPTLSNFSHFHFCPGGHSMWEGERPLSMTLYQPSRPHLERIVAERVRALSNVKIIENCDVVGLVTSASRDRVIGARIAPRGNGHAEEIRHADLVVDATGRSGRTTTWLPAMGYPSPAEEQLVVQVKYVTQHLRLAPGAADRERLVVVGAVPDRPTTVFLIEQEDKRWTLTLGGYGRHGPPTDWEGMLDFLRVMVRPHILAMVRDAEPVSPVFTHRFPANLRRHYERLREFPAGLLVLGDALCSFNPLYGQGMSVAAMQVSALHAELARGEHDLAKRFFRAATKPIDTAWQLAAAPDLALPEVPGPRPISVRVMNAYMTRLLTAAERDPVLSDKFLRVGNLVDPPTKLLGPPIMRRVMAGNRRRKRAAQPVVPDVTAPPAAGAVGG